MLAGRLAQAQAGGYAEMRDIVLQDDQHQRGKGDHPEQGIAVLRARGQVGSPVAWIYKTYGNDKPRADILKYLQPAERLKVW